jgi:Major Facilitator Superfamily/Molybdopterin oxidoreductase
VLLVYAFAVVMAGTTLPTPMYALYATTMSFTVLTTTVIYGMYAGGVLAALVVFGRWSDAIGRRPILLGGVVLAIASDATFLTADTVPGLVAARVLSGLSVGLFTGTATAAVIEVAPPKWRTRAAILRAVRDRHGTESIGVAWGNPIAWNYSATVTMNGFAAALKTKHHYTSASIDVNNYWVAADMMYGNSTVNPLPDFAASSFALIVGANPVVSHGSLVTTGRIREVLLDIPRRGGRVVVVDPRRTETARLFEHVPITPGADAWLLMAMIRVIFDEDLHDAQALDRQTAGADGRVPNKGGRRAQAARLRAALSAGSDTARASRILAALQLRRLQDHRSSRTRPNRCRRAGPIHREPRAGSGGSDHSPQARKATPSLSCSQL